ncbi:hypothetical protein L596_013171 [Steinernema carpocapsae]|uniref:Acid phosphatase n=1 Tax=Steinernema carpocapsae TaxID=34508 RepID=A0A4U5NZB2_STECR|nr:hypothetical protein L596_013171 [Steinernema carpocapsae]
MRYSILIWVFLLATVAHGAELLQIQAIWRHGDRPPTGKTYPTDPYQEDAWPVKFGELTPRGMWQQYTQGQKLKQEYIVKQKLIKAKYDPSDIYVRSTDVDRVLASAYSNLAGFYSEPNGTYPNEAAWPSKWTPIAVHTTPKDLDLLMRGPAICPRQDQLLAKLFNHRKIKAMFKKNRAFIDMLQEKTQSNFTTVQDLYQLWNILNCENIHNFTFPAWITQDSEKPLTESRKTWRCDTRPYYAYSGHDSTVGGFLLTVGAKKEIVGERTADYASTVVLELWKLDQGRPHVRLRFSANAESPFVTITDKVVGCPKKEFCPLDTFIRHRKKYLLTNYAHACVAKNS